ncbi:MAG: GntR family transcriptional regulator [Clostridiales bacterium]|nr:GntR family transcriptional regulator [Clostridiales bacterium]
MEKYYRSRPRDAAAEQIECYLCENGLKAGDRLPSERDMCGRWGFNRTTLRSAIHRLIVEGVLINRVGSGTFVAPKKLVCNLQDLRAFSVVVAESGRSLENRLVTAQMIECSKPLAQKLKQPLGHRIFEMMRVRVVDSVPVLLETSYVDAERCRGIEQYDFEAGSLYATLERDYGIALKNGIEKLGVTYAGTDEAQLLEVPEGSPLIHRVGIAEDFDGVPVEYFKSVARSEYLRFASVLTR